MEKIKAFFKERWFEIFGLTIVGQLLVTAFCIWVQNNLIIILLSCAIVVLLVMLVFSISEKMKPKSQSIFEGRALSMERKGVAFTVGLHSAKEGSPLMKVLNRQKPRYCAFIGTDDTYRLNIVQQFIDKTGIKAGFFKEENINPTDMIQIKKTTSLLIDWMIEMGLSPKEIVVDVTGGNVPMSIAAYMAATELGVDTQYIYSAYKDNKPVDGTQKALLISQG